MKLKFYQRILVLSALLIFVILIWKIEPGCLVQKFINIPCPTCGMTRAFFAMINGDFETSFNVGKQDEVKHRYKHTQSNIDWKD